MQEQDKSMSVFHIKTVEFVNGSSDKYYGIKNFSETDSCFQFLFDVAKQARLDTMKDSHTAGFTTIVTNANTLSFDGGVATYNYDISEVFVFRRLYSGFVSVLLRPKPILRKALFEKKEILPVTTIFKGNFDELNIDVLQSFINDVYDEMKLDKEKLTHAYELYNKEDIRKVVINYHDNGKWFDIDVH